MTQIIVAVISILPTIISIIINFKMKKQNNIMQEITKSMLNLKDELVKSDKEIVDNLKEAELMTDKRWLLDFLNRVKQGDEMSEEQIRMAHETKKRYNSQGGDSYIDDFWDRMKSEKKF